MSNLTRHDFIKTTALATLAFAVTGGTAFAKKATPDEKRAKLNEMSGQVLERMYKKYSSAENAVKNAYAYCTISASSIKWGFWGDDHGRGVAVNNDTGEKIYVKLQEVSVGVNFGAKEYDLLFIIADKAAWDRFISGNIKFGSETSADVTDGVSDVSYAGATSAAKGVQVYQLDKKGLAVEATFKGGKISKYKTLN